MSAPIHLAIALARRVLPDRMMDALIAVGLKASTRELPRTGPSRALASS